VPRPTLDEVQPDEEITREHDPYPLLRRSPFAIGFLGAVGAMVAVALANALTQLTSIIVLVVVALFLALGLNPLVEELVTRGLRRGLAVGAVAGTGLIIVGLGSTAVVPVITRQVDLLVRNAPGYLQQLRANPTIAGFDAEYQVLSKATEYLTSGALLNNVFGGLLGAGMYLANALFSVFITLVLTVYFLFTLESIKLALYQLSPASVRGRVRHISGMVFSRIGGYLTGMFILVTLASTCAFVMMLIVGLGEYALALAFIVAVCWFVPLIGASVAAVIVSIMGFTVSPTIGIICLVYFLVYIQFDAYVVQPRVMARQVNVPGALVVVAALAGGTLLGIVGALLAVPTMAVLLVLYREIAVPHLEAT
jgi:predicted PurR-regulated permease PerM